jgi:thiol-disulfide isomerase/thioredoxin
MRFIIFAFALLLISCSENTKEELVPEIEGEIGEKEEGKREERTSFTSSSQKSLLSKKVFSLQSAENGTITLSKEGNRFIFDDLQSPLVLLDFFTTWCPACRAVAPHLGSLQAKYPQELTVVGVLVEEGKNRDDIIKFKKRYRAEYIITSSRDNFRLSNSVASLLRMPRSYPIPLLVLFKNGEYFTHYVGAVPEEMVESDIKEALGLRGE